MMRNPVLSIFIGMVSLFASFPAQACESCGCVLSRAGSDPLYGSSKAFFDFTFEGLNWNARPASDAHELHEEGHDVHNKTHEEFYHFNLGVNPVEDLTVLAELPYVVRTSTEVHDEDRIGEKETSEGLGDLKLSAIYRFWRGHGHFLGILGGIKLPTGSTEEENSAGEVFEPELQPGSGSTDGFAGGAFQLDLSPVLVHGNVVYTFRSEGDHGFRYGDLFSSYISIDTRLNPGAKGSRVLAGVDMDWQIEGKHIEEGEKVEDSGGNTFLLGPSVKIEVNDHVAVLCNVLLPVYQNVGGVHQKLDLAWNASVKVAW